MRDEVTLQLCRGVPCCIARLVFTCASIPHFSCPASRHVWIRTLSTIQVDRYVYIVPIYLTIYRYDVPVYRRLIQDSYFETGLFSGQ
jgi:hypothetical protein